MTKPKKDPTSAELAEALADALAARIVKRKPHGLAVFMVANAGAISRCLRRLAEIERKCGDSQP